MSNKKIFDKRFVFTGEFNSPRDELSNRALTLGGRVTTAISGKTDYLVTGVEPGPSKVQKAKDMKIQILNETDFHQLIADEKDSMKPKAECEIKRPVTLSTDKRLWTVKYEPTDYDHILGNKSARGQLLAFLSNLVTGRGLLIHGPPGVGKSLSIKLACEKVNKKMIEFNASDVRNKGCLVEKISRFTCTVSLTGKDRVLVMDECDGMTGDRGGLTELGQIIRKSKIPVVCICNDRQVVKNLTGCCDEITFRKLETRQILGCLREILKNEKVKMPDSKIIETITLANHDLRFTLNSLQGAGKFKKSIATNIFDEAISIFRPTKINQKYDSFFKDYDIMPLMVFENYLHCDVSSEISQSSTLRAHRSLKQPTHLRGHSKNQSLNQERPQFEIQAPKKSIDRGHQKILTKTTLESQDISKQPSYVPTSRLYRINECAISLYDHKLREYALASESISLSEMYSNISDWSLLPYAGFFSTVLSTKNLRLHRRLEFPKELGHLSKRNKNKRILNTFHFHMLSRCNFSQFYFYQFDHIVLLYISHLSDGDIPSAINLLKHYNLTKTDLDESIDFLNLGKLIQTKNKSAMTRAYKKMKRVLPYNIEE